MRERAIAFDCDGDTLVGILHLPEGSARDLGILIIVGGPQYRVGSHRQFVLMARDFASAGYPVLRFDYRGMGDSTGSPRSFDAIDTDVRAALDAFLAESPAIRGVAVFGLCDAASAALMYGHSDPRVKRLILANPWVRTEAGEARARVRHYYRQRLLSRAFWKKVSGGEFNPVQSTRDYVASLWRARSAARDDSRRETPVAFLARMELGFAMFRGPILLLMSGKDLTAKEFQDHCQSTAAWRRLLERRNVRQLALPDADHTFSSPASLSAAASTIVDWFGTDSV